MRRKIIGVTVGTPISAAKIEQDLKPEIKAVADTLGADIQANAERIGAVENNMATMGNLEALHDDLMAEINDKASFSSLDELRYDLNGSIQSNTEKIETLESDMLTKPTYGDLEEMDSRINSNAEKIDSNAKDIALLYDTLGDYGESDNELEKSCEELYNMVERYVPFVRDEEHQVFIPDPDAVYNIINDTDGVITVKGIVETEWYGEYKVGGLLISHAKGEYGKQCTFIGNAIDEEEINQSPFYCFYAFDTDSTLYKHIGFIADQADLAANEKRIVDLEADTLANTKRVDALEEQIGQTGNALLGEYFGREVWLDDIIPTPNTVKVTLESKNLVPTVYKSAARGQSITIAGITFTVNDDGSVTMNGKNNGNDHSSFFLVNSTTQPLVLKKGTYIGGVGVDGLYLTGLVQETGKYVYFSTPYTVEKDTALRFLYFGVSNGSSREFNGETVYPMLMRGTVCEDYCMPAPEGDATSFTCGDYDLVHPDAVVGETYTFSDVEKGAHVVIDAEHMIFHVEYNRDINMAFAELQQAIISLGGNV